MFSHLSNATYTTEPEYDIKHTSTRWLNVAIIHLSITCSLIIRTSVKVSYSTFFPFKIFITQTTAKLFCSPNVPAHDVSIHVLCKIALDTDHIHKASHLHVDANATSEYHFHWISCDKCYINEVPSLCDFSRCLLSWLRLVKLSEQCLHEYGFAPVWIRTWHFRSLFVLNNLSQ